MISKKQYHIPVLLEESINNLITDKNGIYVDATYGLGGHSYSILKKLEKKSILIAIDQDKDSIKKNFIIDKRFYLFHNNFINIKDILNLFSLKKISGMIVDLGLSSFQIENLSKGFSIKENCILDMRMNQESNSFNAKNVINEYSEEKLCSILKEYGDFKNAKKIVKKILDKRITKEINTSYDLKNIFLIKGSFKKRKRFFSRLFQSIRIEVNNEISMLKKLLYISHELILSGGRLVIISYHSIEDRIVKNFLKKGIFLRKKINYKPFKIINKKVIKPTVNELKSNSRSRSAKLRVAERL
ncbi:16S rRNA (cytosine(1402)-N(4))-methyltransferase RsmH [Blattabacterium cuenoti]|uniref:16S rRNA (cytosine(1402)-N(4))-methyltransferase RsmH n=1 Tax=Blattabacterium cuenoti TaxID=1653831 RepID=UPI00163BB250|nr:16S rRNA (cytosine(1402)-N(4))-methyltransferase RsmH [Blattabacterium cuenoti]